MRRPVKGTREARGIKVSVAFAPDLFEEIRAEATRRQTSFAEVVRDLVTDGRCWRAHRAISESTRDILRLAPVPDPISQPVDAKSTRLTHFRKPLD